MSRTAWERKAPDFYWKQNDTAPSIAEQLVDGNGAAVVLTGATVKFMAWIPGQATAKVNATATVDDAATGKVSYAPIAADTDTVCDMMAEWQVTFSSPTRIETFPNSGWQKIRVVDDIAA